MSKWPESIKSDAKRLWQTGCPRDRIVIMMRPASAFLGLRMSVHVLNGFAIRGKWGRHPLSPPNSQQRKAAAVAAIEAKP